MAWSQLSPVFPTEMADTIQTMNQGLSAARESVRAARTLIAAKAAFATTTATGYADLGQAALEGLLSAARGALDALLDDVGAHVLIVPLPKKGLAYVLPDEMSVPSSAPAGGMAATLGREISQTPVWQQAFSASSLFTGGNAHFLKTVSEAATDTGDGHRPTFKQDSYWGYVAMLGGSTDIGAAMTLAPFFAQLLGAPRRSGDVSASRGDTDLIAQNVSIQPYPRGGAVALNWGDVTERPMDDGWGASPHRYAVIRSEGPEAMGVRTVLDLFKSSDLEEGMVGRFQSKVLKVSKYNPLVQRYVDEATLTDEQAYYYHVAIQTKINGPQGQNSVLPFNLLSTAVRHRPVAGNAPRARAGTPPDWYRTPSVAQLIPAFGQLLDRVNAAVDSVMSATTRVTGVSQASLTALDRLITKLDRYVGELDLVVAQLGTAYTTPNVGLYTTFRQGRGNVTSLIGDLAQALSDATDADRPDFDTGDEYVCGAFVVVTSPSEAAFLRAWALIELLFGPADEADPVVAGVQSIANEIAQTSARLTDPPPSRTFNEDLSPRPVGQGDSSCE